MDTLVELFGNNSIENLLSCRVFAPKNIVFICDKNIEEQKTNVVKIALSNWGLQGINTQFVYVDTGDFNDITKAMEKVLQDYSNVVFDVTGGSDLMLFSSGILCERYNTPHFFIDMHNLTFHNIKSCEYLRESFILPRFRVKDVLASAGARIDGYYKYRPDKKDTQIGDDILAAWDILWQNPKEWADQINWFQQALKKTDHGQLSYNSTTSLQFGNMPTVYANPKILNKLKDIGVITSLSIKNNQISLTFKNPELKNCLTVQGIWLELYGFLKAYRTRWFNDVKTSVEIGWAAKKTTEQDTKNEIDIMLVKGVTPVFVSCKMGTPSALALSEIKTLSTRFGGMLSKTVLLTGADVRKNNPAILRRARDLDIFIIDKQDIDADRVARRLAEISNTYN